MTPTHAQLQWVLNHISEMLSCPQDGTRLRYGDVECPHCGADIADVLEAWAARLLEGLPGDPKDQ
ncbi:MAG: hypothetical protein EXR55_06320 [Dehalococcoidia bacterium]|nr:hypothetical protein [Dehalococcoidia bacterium]